MPSGSSLVAQGDDLLRQHQASVQSTLVEEHYFSDSATSAGIHKPGSARLFYGLDSSVSTLGSEADDAGRFHFASDTEKLRALGYSNNTLAAVAPAYAKVYLSAVTNVAYGLTGQSTKSILWTAEEYDTHNFFSASSIGLQIPAGLGGYYQIDLRLQYENHITLADGANPGMYINIGTDDGEILAFDEYVSSDGTRQHHFNHLRWVGQLSATSHVYAYLNHLNTPAGSTSDATLDSGTTRTWLALTRIA